MLGNTHFYNRTIRKLVVAFGTMFNDIEVVRFDKNGNSKEHIRVPLNYGPKEKYLTRITSDPDLVKSINTVVPRMAFELTSLSYDNSRKQISTTQNFSYSSTTGLSTQYNPIPYNFDFTLSIYVRNTEDGTQILEQILPFFTPDYTVTLDLITGMDQKYDIPIILNDVSSVIDYEGDMSTTRLIIWTLTFTMRGYIFPRVKTGSSYIREANTNVYSTTDVANNNVVASSINTLPNPSNSEPDDTFGFTETITIFPDTL